MCACTFEFSASTLLLSLYLGDAFSSCIETIKKLTELLKTKTFCCFRTTFTYRKTHGHDTWSTIDYWSNTWMKMCWNIDILMIRPFSINLGWATGLLDDDTFLLHCFKTTITCKVAKTVRVLKKIMKCHTLNHWICKIFFIVRRFFFYYLTFSFL